MGQDFVVNFDQPHGMLGGGLAGRSHSSNGMTVVEHFVPRQTVVADIRHILVIGLGEVSRRYDGFHTGRSQRFAYIDRLDSCVGVRAP